MSSILEDEGGGLKTRLSAITSRNDLSVDETSSELSMRRTGLSFQRTRMSADRTLMSVVRTSLSLISFGFTIFQAFRSFKQAGQITEGVADSARNFGLSLVVLGVAMLIAGIVYQVVFMKQLRKERAVMVEEGLIHGELSYPTSMTLITAILLLILGLVAIFSMITKNGPFG